MAAISPYSGGFNPPGSVIPGYSAGMSDSQLPPWLLNEARSGGTSGMPPSEISNWVNYYRSNPGAGSWGTFFPSPGNMPYYNAQLAALQNAQGVTVQGARRDLATGLAKDRTGMAQAVLGAGNQAADNGIYGSSFTPQAEQLARAPYLKDMSALKATAAKDIAEAQSQFAAGAGGLNAQNAQWQMSQVPEPQYFQNGAVNRAAWARSFLQALGAPVTPQDIAVISVLAGNEGFAGGGANQGGMWNPLSVTTAEPGSWNYNSVGVQNFPTEEAGIRATIATLQNGEPYYAGVLQALRGGNAQGALMNWLRSPWGWGIGDLGRFQSMLGNAGYYENALMGPGR